MKQFAALTTQAQEALSTHDWSRFHSLMDDNFQLRRSLYGDDCIGQTNLRMAELGKKYGAACKFPGETTGADVYTYSARRRCLCTLNCCVSSIAGSGGAILGLLPDASVFEELKKDYESEGFVVTKVIPNVK